MRSAVLSAAFILLLGVTASDAMQVYLGDQNRGPNGDIEIAGIVFSSGDFYGGQPTGVAGSGIGSATVGPSDWVNYAWHFPLGSLTRDTMEREGLSLYV